MKSLLCKGEGCQTVLENSDNLTKCGTSFYCTACLMNFWGKWNYICHDCGDLFMLAYEVDDHWHDEHAPVYPKDLKK